MSDNGNSRKHSNGNGRSAAGDRTTKQRSNVLPAFQFIRCEFTRDQKEALISAISSGAITAEQTYDLVSEGYKLSLTRDTKASCYIASLSDNRDGSRTQGYVLSARGATIAIALCALSFKHNVVLADGWLESLTSAVEQNEWGIG